MPPKTKVETSPHFNEIVDLLLDGWSGRKLSEYLKKQYNEDIGFNAINNYRKNYLDVESEADMIVKEKKAAAIKKEASKRDKAQENFDKAVERNVNAQSVIELAVSYGGDVVEEVMNNPDIPSLDKARLIKDFVKLNIDLIKTDDTYVDVNVNNNMSSYFDEDKVREILNAKRKREKGDSE